MTQYDEQEKTKSASPGSKTNESTKTAHKMPNPATDATQQPAWSQVLGNQPPARLQAKLTVSQPGNIYEQEADRVAEQVMRMPTTNAASPTSVRSETIMRKGASSETGSSEGAPLIVNQALHSSGQPLDNNTKAMLELQFCQDFSDVRVHTDGQAANQRKRSMRERIQ